ncbi:MAG: TonB-dependent receptor [Cytophagales bacterium]|nr:TonB-dependent receptor [Bernardetiaceae bacterium]MDW8204681.1 TonB-dependent receptor [Cytophagales bacterium]
MKSFIKKIVFLVIISLSIAHLAVAQHKTKTIHGYVAEQIGKEEQPLIGASVMWLGTTLGTVTDEKGHFELKYPSNDPQAHLLVVSFAGYKTDTVNIHQANTHQHGRETHIEIILQPLELKTVTITAGKTDELSPMRVDVLTTKDLRKAACCNLSESFETQASVDVSFSDAVSGAKQIHMLGLDGVYAQISSENLPAVRGLSARSGMYFIPGTWIRSIDISKGAGSVVNGYESITGQINVELIKPFEETERLFFNTYVNQFGRVEQNIHWRKPLNSKWATATLLHASGQRFREDFNQDGFLDAPQFSQLNGISRWQYNGEKMEAQLGVKALYDDKMGGQLAFRKNTPVMRGSIYGFRWENQRTEFFSKIGFFLPKPTESIGIIVNATNHRVKSLWGDTRYNGKQQYFMFNSIYQNQFGDNHILKAGVSAAIDYYDEQYNLSQRTRHERVAGVFTEYSFTLPRKLVIVAGLRYDRHNLAGHVVTPRLHFKYDFSPLTSLRLSAGRGMRFANPIAENMGYLVSNRQLNIADNLLPERAWNMGGSLHQKFLMNDRNGSVTVDFFRTEFENQTIVDLDSDPHQLKIYNLNGRSFANSLQLQAEYQLAEGFNVTGAYKFYDVRAQIGDKLRPVPFIPKHRAMANAEVDIKRWRFDLTVQWYGAKRLPVAPTVGMPMPGDDHSSHTNPTGAPYWRAYSPHYFLINSQVTRVFRTWEVYMGMENMGNFMQMHPIVEAENPWGQHFDAGIIWAPIMGRMLYAGLRIMIE